VRRSSSRSSERRKGPNLDDEGSSYRDVVGQVVEGGGGMPSFARSLTRTQIRAIATFVAHAAASSGDD
jgi:mono/diheme cytochrome c family protein